MASETNKSEAYTLPNGLSESREWVDEKLRELFINEEFIVPLCLKHNHDLIQTSDRPLLAFLRKQKSLQIPEVFEAPIKKPLIACYEMINVMGALFSDNIILNFWSFRGCSAFLSSQLTTQTKVEQLEPEPHAPDLDPQTKQHFSKLAENFTEACDCMNKTLSEQLSDQDFDRKMFDTSANGYLKSYKAIVQNLKSPDVHLYIFTMTVWNTNDKKPRDFQGFSVIQLPVQNEEEKTSRNVQRFRIVQASSNFPFGMPKDSFSLSDWISSNGKIQSASELREKWINLQSLEQFLRDFVLVTEGMSEDLYHTVFGVSYTDDKMGKQCASHFFQAKCSLQEFSEKHRLFSNKSGKNKEKLERALQFKESGNSLFGQKKFLEAAKEYSSANDISPNAVFLFNRGMCWKNCGFSQPAVKDFKEATKLDPTHEKAFFQLSVLDTQDQQPKHKEMYNLCAKWK